MYRPTPKNTQKKEMLSLSVLFVVLLWLLYTLSVFIHKTSKINEEIDVVRRQNEQMQTEIEEKKAYLAYLRTAERIEKEAKIQLGRKRPNENVIIVVEEKTSLIDPSLTEKSSPMIQNPLTTVSQNENWKKWEYLFFGE